jgi:hypothetical protein
MLSIAAAWHGHGHYHSSFNGAVCDSGPSKTSASPPPFTTTCLACTLAHIHLLLPTLPHRHNKGRPHTNLNAASPCGPGRGAGPAGRAAPHASAGTAHCRCAQHAQHGHTCATAAMYTIVSAITRHRQLHLHRGRGNEQRTLTCAQTALAVWGRQVNEAAAHSRLAPLCAAMKHTSELSSHLCTSFAGKS